MTQLNWGNMAKDLNSNQTIPQAIAEAVTVHNDDPDAHIGPTRALESHRAAEIIDHRAESVVNDKIKANARTYAAIVDNNSAADYDTIEDALDYVFGLGSGTVFVRKGNYTPQRQLKFKYGVDLIGEGPGETVINRVAGINDYMSLDGAQPVSWRTVPQINYTADTDVMEVIPPDGVELADIQLCYMDTPWGDGYFLGLVGQAELSFYNVPSESGTLYDHEVVPRIMGAAGQNTVHVEGWQLIYEMPSGDGLVMMDKFRSTIGVVDTYLGNGTYRLTENLNSDVDALGLSFRAEGGRMSIISGVTINCNGLGAIFKNDDIDGRAFVRDSAFTNCTDIVTGQGRRLTIEDTEINFTSGAVTCNTGGATLRNCTLDFGYASSCTAIGGNGTMFENCSFIGGPLSGTNLMSRVEWWTTFNHCYFQNFCAGAVVNNFLNFMQETARAPKFVGCMFFNSGAGSILFRGRGIIVEACGFHTQQNTDVGLDATSKRCMFVGNEVKGTQPTTPALCLAANNLYHTENQSSYNGSSTP